MIREIPSHILAEIKRLHFSTEKLVTEGVAGQYKSAFRGQGVEFEEVREYVPGDDVRSIDWKVSSRLRKPYVKSYREERELTVYIVVDVSGSTFTGTRVQSRDSLMARVGAVLTLIAQKNNDKVGLLTYSSEVEHFAPPRKAKTAVWRILHEVLAPNVSSKGTDLNGLFTFLNRVIKRRSIIFVLSDFFDTDYQSPLSVLARRHDVTLIRSTDPADHALPKVGLLRVKDPETGAVRLIDTSSKAVQESYKSQAKAADEYFLQLSRSVDLKSISISTDEPFMHVLQQYFYARDKKRRRLQTAV